MNRKHIWAARSSARTGSRTVTGGDQIKYLDIEMNEKFLPAQLLRTRKSNEPETLWKCPVDNFQIPMSLVNYRNEWVIRQRMLYSLHRWQRTNATVSGSLEPKQSNRKKFKIGGQVKDGVWLLAKYLQLALETV